MPTERFMRLPKEKIEAIRIAAAREYMRVPPEEVSINRIIHNADISRGSFYTYFEDKQDLLKWLICAHAERHFNIYIDRLQENGGDLWEMFGDVFDRAIDFMESNGMIEIFQNLIKSAKFIEVFKGGPDSDPRALEANREFIDRLYENIDHERYPLDKDTLFDLLEMQMVVFLMSLKKFFRDGEAREDASAYYKRHIHMLHYGVCAYKDHHSNNETYAAGEKA